MMLTFEKGVQPWKGEPGNFGSSSRSDLGSLGRPTCCLGCSPGDLSMKSLSGFPLDPSGSTLSCDGGSVGTPSRWRTDILKSIIRQQNSNSVTSGGGSGFNTKVSRMWPSFPSAQLGENLLHLSEDVSERWRFLDPHPVRTKAEAEPQGTVEGILSVPRIVEKPILLLIVFVFIVGHCIEEGVPVTSKSTNTSSTGVCLSR